MSKKVKNNNIWQRRLTLALAMLLCFFVSSIEYATQPEFAKIEQQQAQEDAGDHTIISMAVDAVVPFAIQLTQTAFYFIYDIISFEPRSFTLEVASLDLPNQLIEILFERIISTLGP